jgi:pilus assembly protein Flp/PilA
MEVVLMAAADAKAATSSRKAKGHADGPVEQAPAPERSREVGTCRHTPSRGSQVMTALRDFLDDEEGQDVVEYGLLIATIAIVVLAAVGLFGVAIRDWFTSLAGRITTT